MTMKPNKHLTLINLIWLLLSICLCALAFFFWK
jgi:hypothetical protein